MLYINPFVDCNITGRNSRSPRRKIGARVNKHNDVKKPDSWPKLMGAMSDDEEDNTRTELSPFPSHTSLLDNSTHTVTFKPEKQGKLGRDAIKIAFIFSK